MLVRQRSGVAKARTAWPSIPGQGRWFGAGGSCAAEGGVVRVRGWVAPTPPGTVGKVEAKSRQDQGLVACHRGSRRGKVAPPVASS